jgi:hypothetical protein
MKLATGVLKENPKYLNVSFYKKRVPVQRLYF